MQLGRAGCNKTAPKCLRRQRVPAIRTGAARQTFESPANGSQEPLTYSLRGRRPPIAQANPLPHFRSPATSCVSLLLSWLGCCTVNLQRYRPTRLFHKLFSLKSREGLRNRV